MEKRNGKRTPHKSLYKLDTRQTPKQSSNRKNNNTKKLKKANIQQKISNTQKKSKKEVMKRANLYNNNYIRGGGSGDRRNSSNNNAITTSANNLIKENGMKLLAPDESGDYVYKYYRKDDDSTFHKDPKRCMCINYKSVNDFDSYDRCKNNAIENSDFCVLHQDCKSYLRQFLSGSEYDNDIKLWSNPLIEGSHNCYSYFLNRMVKAVKEKCDEICKSKYKNTEECISQSGCTDLKPQPGDFDIIRKFGSDDSNPNIYKCPEMQKKILADNPTLKPIEFNKKCPRGYYKGAMVVDSEDSEDGNTYHFYKQISDGTFLHKPGINPVSNVDSAFTGEKGRTIYVPHFANRDYGRPENEGIFYNGFCGYYCIPRNDVEHKNLA